MELLQKLKRDSLETFLSFGVACLLVDSYVRGLTIPEKLENQGEVLFVLGYNLPRPIPDLEITDEGVSATLLFGEESFKVFVPWEAVTYTGLKETCCGCRFVRTIAEFGEELEDKTKKPFVSEVSPEPESDQQGKVIPFGVIDGGKK